TDEEIIASNIENQKRKEALQAQEEARREERRERARALGRAMGFDVDELERQYSDDPEPAASPSPKATQAAGEGARRRTLAGYGGLPMGARRAGGQAQACRRRDPRPRRDRARPRVDPARRAPARRGRGADAGRRGSTRRHGLRHSRALRPPQRT